MCISTLSSMFSCSGSSNNAEVRVPSEHGTMMYSRRAGSHRVIKAVALAAIAAAGVYFGLVAAGVFSPVILGLAVGTGALSGLMTSLFLTREKHHYRLVVDGTSPNPVLKKISDAIGPFTIDSSLDV